MMNIIEMDVSQLIPYENNPRKNDSSVDKVALSISAFGFKVPIVIDKNNVIVTGHTRLKAAKKLGLKKVPVIRADDLTDEQIKAFRLADNKVGEFSEWDFDKLEKELQELETDMSLFGFDVLEKELPIDEEPDEDDLFSDIEKKEKHYGVPYQGNKSRIADIIINILPAGKRLVDLFGGGGAITHCALLADKWENYLYNDINPLITGLFMDAVNGKYHNEKRVITREDFNNLKDSDAYIKYIWSFGNNGTGYLWGEDIEEIKQQACRFLIDGDLNERRLNYVKFIRLLKNTTCTTLYRLQSLEHLQTLKELETLKRLESLEHLQVSNISYKDFKYKAGDIVYCDVPYEQVGKSSCDDYGVDFNSLEFYEWVKSREYQVFFSSYEISDESFYKVKLKSIQSLIGSSTNGQYVNEYLYSNKPIEYI